LYFGLRLGLYFGEQLLVAFTGDAATRLFLLRVLLVYLSEKVHFDLRVFDLFLDDDIYGVVVGKKLVALEKLDCGLIELEHHNFVEEAEALDFGTGRLNAGGELGDFVDFVVFGHEPMLEGLLALLDERHFLDLLLLLGDAVGFAALHFVLLGDGFDDSL
jgi:hypothetical protein